MSLLKSVFKVVENIDSSKYTNFGNGIMIISLLILSISRILFPFDLGNYESAIWTSALLTIDGNNPYTFATQPPYTVSPYGYVFYLIIGIGLKFFGFQFWFGRIFSLIATSICVVCLIKIVSLLTKNKLATYISVLIFLCSFGLQSWIASQRSDFVALAFALLGLTLVFYDSKSIKTSLSLNLVAILLLTLAVFCKHTTILPISIAVLRYFQVGKYKQAIITFLGVGLLGLLMAFILNHTSEGEYYFQHFYITRNISYSYLRSILVAKSVFLTTTGVFIYSILFLGIVYFIKNTWSAENDNKQFFEKFKLFILQFVKSYEFLFLFYFITSFTLNFYASARNGSSINYYLEFILVTAILIGLVIDHIKILIEKKTILVGLVFILVLGGTVNIIRAYRGEYFRWHSLPYYREIVETLDNSVPKDAICFTSYSDFVAFAERKYEFSDWMQYEDNRSPKLKQIFSETLQSNRYSALILQDPDFEKINPNCKFIPMKNPIPVKAYSVYLYLCNNNASEKNY